MRAKDIKFVCSLHAVCQSLPSLFTHKWPTIILFIFSFLYKLAIYKRVKRESGSAGQVPFYFLVSHGQQQKTNEWLAMNQEIVCYAQKELEAGRYDILFFLLHFSGP